MPKLYHYTSFENAIEFILPHKSLRTNYLSEMNDPKENQQWAFGGINIDYKSIYPNEYSNDTHIFCQQKLGEEIKGKVQALSFVNSDEEDGFKNEMMWAHYGKNHKGLCLEIDVDKFIEENTSINFFKFENIKYLFEKKPSIYWDKRLSKEENINNIIKKNYKSLFLTKSKYWEKESEIRLLLIDNTRNYLKIKKSLSGVYVGLSMSTYYYPCIFDLLNISLPFYKVYYERNEIKRWEINR
ncbi:Protein of unknown function (DUF2971) [Lutibacter sp. Hel_I_33_5]|uniref:DUF2971 domain-containing protein n=1 Tax=Lutibacter sp. Hel_I_33_5 TaxID=1566289 RepID=UPI0011A1D7DE|nr:DUF2971 domain-containing protein [Lutibacter sp. Hel_I_33_5]TVZ56623.1 Protein of unknown function (DUF2971) [Lutibacter sp. Hel_I_33_5]